MQGANNDVSADGECDVMTAAASVIAYAEVTTRYVLHWDCRGALLLPHVARRLGARHVEELHLRRCGLRELQASDRPKLTSVQTFCRISNQCSAKNELLSIIL